MLAYSQTNVNAHIISAKSANGETLLLEEISAGAGKWKIQWRYRNVSFSVTNTELANAMNTIPPRVDDETAFVIK